jgi:tetratricopeptide (TPR) repeat protein
MGQPQRALELYEQALLIMREVEDQAGEAAVLNGQAFLYQNLQRYDEACRSFETSIQLAGEVARPALVALGLVGLAIVFYRHLNRPIEAINHLQSAISLLQKPDFPQGADVPPIEHLQQLLATMEQDTPFQREQAVSTLPSELVQQIATITITVMTVSPEQRSSWHKRIMLMQQDLQQRGPAWQREVEFYTALLDLLTGHIPTLLSEHPYAQVIAAIQQGIATQ